MDSRLCPPTPSMSQLQDAATSPLYPLPLPPPLTYSRPMDHKIPRPPSLSYHENGSARQFGRRGPQYQRCCCASTCTREPRGPIPIPSRTMLVQGTDSNCSYGAVQTKSLTPRGYYCCPYASNCPIEQPPLGPPMTPLPPLPSPPLPPLPPSLGHRSSYREPVVGVFAEEDEEASRRHGCFRRSVPSMPMVLAVFFCLLNCLLPGSGNAFRDSFGLACISRFVCGVGHDVQSTERRKALSHDMHAFSRRRQSGVRPAEYLCESSFSALRPI